MQTRGRAHAGLARVLVSGLGFAAGPGAGSHAAFVIGTAATFLPQVLLMAFVVATLFWREVGGPEGLSRSCWGSRPRGAPIRRHAPCAACPACRDASHMPRLASRWLLRTARPAPRQPQHAPSSPPSPPFHTPPSPPLPSTRAGQEHGGGRQPVLRRPVLLHPVHAAGRHQRDAPAGGAPAVSAGGTGPPARCPPHACPAPLRAACRAACLTAAGDPSSEGRALPPARGAWYPPGITSAAAPPLPPPYRVFWKQRHMRFYPGGWQGNGASAPLCAVHPAARPPP